MDKKNCKKIKSSQNFDIHKIEVDCISTDVNELIPYNFSTVTAVN